MKTLTKKAAEFAACGARFGLAGTKGWQGEKVYEQSQTNHRCGVDVRARKHWRHGADDDAKTAGFINDKHKPEDARCEPRHSEYQSDDNARRFESQRINNGFAPDGRLSS
jgi:hypothetical protein